MKLNFILLVLISTFSRILGQDTYTFRTVVIKQDTLFECYKNGETECSYIDTGININVTSPNNKLFYWNEIKGNVLNGVHILFYINSSVIEESGYYLEGEKDGYWRYWNNDGRLIKKEFWSKGKLRSKVLFKEKKVSK